MTNPPEANDLGLDRIGGRSRPILRVLDQVRHVASTRATVLIEGEAGTGKGLVARALHDHSPRKEQSFVSADCAGFAADTAEGELFGHEPGASVANGMSRKGRFELADGGTLFLDQVGETPPALQVKLLRAIQERCFERVGGAETRRSDVRLISATDRDLGKEVNAGRFREDLYYRLSVVRIHMPPLRERTDDIPFLVEGFLHHFNRQHRRKVTGVTRGALDRLERYPWPGNVRELRNTIEAMVIFAEGKRPLDLSDLPEALRCPEDPVEQLEITVGMTVDEAERQLIAATLRQTANDKPRAAAMLGIGLRTLYRKIKRYRIR